MPSAFGDLNGSGNQQVWVNVARTGQNIAGNYSSYTAEIRYYGNGYGSWSGATQYWSGNFGGYTVSGSFTIPQSAAYQTYTTLWSGNFDKAHDAAGNLAAFACSASIDTSHASIGDGTASTTEGAPPTIPRTSKPTFATSSSVTTGVAATINTNRASTSFTHDMTWNFGNLSGQTTGFSPANTAIGASVTWTPPVTALAQIPNAAVGTGTITSVTKSGSTVIGSYTFAFTLNAASTVIPVVSDITFVDQTALVVSTLGAGNFVQTLSNLKGTVVAAGVQSSTITSKKWSIPLQSVTVDSDQNIVPVATGTVPVTGTAVDSRGRNAATYTENITVLPYTSPFYNTVQVRRATALNTISDSGTQIQIDLNCAAQSLKVATVEKNSLSISVSTRVYGTTPWTAQNVINVVAGTVTYNSAFLVTTGPFVISQSYEVKIEISDKFNTALPSTYIAVITTGNVFMHWSSTGVGIGKYHEFGNLDLQGQGYQNNGLSIIDTGDVASTADVLAASSNTLYVSPLSLSGRVASESASGLAEIATAAEFKAGTDDTRYITPKKFNDVPRFRVDGTGGTAQPVNPGWALANAVWGPPLFNTAGTWAGATLTISDTGYYRIICHLGYTTVGGAVRHFIRITKNVAAETPLTNVVVASASVGINGMLLVGGGYLVAGDVLRVYQFHEYSAAKTIDANQLTFFEIEWLRATL